MNKKTKKTIVVIAILLVLLLTVIPFAISVIVYEQFFGIRYETYAPYTYHVDEFDGLERSKHQFTSDKGQLLTGYLYYTANKEYKGVIVIAHGFGGGGHNSYMDCANYFTNNGYYVFAFDATGNDESQGNSVKGMPQGVIDLSNAITYVESIEEIKDLPIMLFGHSWGGYSVTNVLKYHPEIKAVVTMSGFDCSKDLIESQGKNLVGDWVKLMMPYVNLYEKIKFGEYATNSAIEAMENSSTAVMVFHSEDDETVSSQYGYDVWYEKFKDDSRFKFIKFSDKGHASIYYSYESMEWLEGVNERFRAWGETLDYDYKSADNTQRFEQDKANWINENLDREKWCDQLDKELFAQIIAFYDGNLK